MNCSYAERSPAEFSELFGSAFADAVEALEPGGWSGPVRSAYGFHLVQITERSESREPELAEVRSEVLRDFQADQKRAASDSYYQRLRERAALRVVAPPARLHGPGWASCASSTGVRSSTGCSTWRVRTIASRSLV